MRKSFDFCLPKKDYGFYYNNGANINSDYICKRFVNSFNVFDDKIRVSISSVNPKKKGWKKISYSNCGVGDVSVKIKGSDQRISWSQRKRLIRLGFGTRRVTLWVKVEPRNLTNKYDYFLTKAYSK